MASKKPAKGKSSTSGKAPEAKAADTTATAAPPAKRSTLDELKRKHAEVKASGFKAADDDTYAGASGATPGNAIKALLKNRGAGGGEGAKGGGALRDLIAKRAKAGGESGDGAGAGQLIKRVLQARQGKGGGEAGGGEKANPFLGRIGGARGRAGGADNMTTEDRRERLRRFIESLENEKN